MLNESNSCKPEWICSHQLTVHWLSWVLAGTLGNLSLKDTKTAADSQEEAKEGVTVGEMVTSQVTGTQFSQCPRLACPACSLWPHLAVTEKEQALSQQKAALGQLQFQQNWTTCYPRPET